MIVHFHNLGRIKETELDLRPLTVIIGPNNSNKTYVAYSLYGLWQALYRSSRESALKPSMIGEEDARWTVSELNDWIQENVDITIREFERKLDVFFQDSSHRLFAETHFRINIAADDIYQSLISTGDINTSWRTQEGTAFRSHSFISTFSVDDEQLVVKPVSNEKTDRLAAMAIWRSRSEFGFDSMLYDNVVSALFSRPYLLPAERNAFVITYKVLANRRMKLLLESQRNLFGSRKSNQRQIELLRESGEIRYPQPVEDFLEFLSDIELENSSLQRANESGLEETQPSHSRNRPGKSFTSLATLIEKSIQNANKTVFKPTILGGREIKIRVGKGLDIDLYNASSSIKQLAPLLLYLRYRAAENDLLMIDEPEMNLHPESQAKLLEVLAMLVNRGVKVLLTTHSPYIMAHLNNLVQADGQSDAVKAKQAQSLYLKSKEALLLSDQVSAYEMKDDKLVSLKDPDYGIRWDTLSDVSVDLQQKFFEIEEKASAKTSK